MYVAYNKRSAKCYAWLIFRTANCVGQTAATPGTQVVNCLTNTISCITRDHDRANSKLGVCFRNYIRVYCAIMITSLMTWWRLYETLYQITWKNARGRLECCFRDQRLELHTWIICPVTAISDSVKLLWPAAVCTGAKIEWYYTDTMMVEKWGIFNSKSNCEVY